jgi:hypothetical protein
LVGSGKKKKRGKVGGCKLSAEIWKLVGESKEKKG